MRTYGAAMLTTWIVAGSIFAQSFDVAWNTIDGGGISASTGGAFELGGTSGQPDTGTLSGGAFTLSGGFWPGVADATSTVSIASANPPTASPYGSGVFRDVLQNTTNASVAQGIGVSGTPNEGAYTYAPFQVTFSAAPSPAPAPANVGVSCTDVAGNGAADCPLVASISGAGIGPYLITLSAPPPPRECITFTFAGTSVGQKLQYQVLPGDTNLDGTVNTIDLLWLVQRVNDGTANQTANLARYNLNRSNEPGSPVNTVDFLRLVQLLNGVNTTQVFNGAAVATCP